MLQIDVLEISLESQHQISPHKHLKSDIRLT